MRIGGLLDAAERRAEELGEAAEQTRRRETERTERLRELEKRAKVG